MTTTRRARVIQAPYTEHRRIAFRSSEVLTMPDVRSIVFVVDDDVSVRDSLELLIKSAGWTPERFVSAQDFLFPTHDDGSELSRARRNAAWPQRPRAAEAAG
jgi:hypothetical protein